MTTTFSDRIARAPRAHDPARGDEALSLLAGLDGASKELVRGAAGSSPYLSDLIGREAEWLAQALEAAPEDTMAAILATPVPDDPKEAGVTLRGLKSRTALLVALADLGGVWTLEEVTGALTRFADRSVSTALRAALVRELGKGRVPGQTEADIDTGAGLAVLAMGKMGAFELNYSSDIDLICLFDETRFDPADYAEARTGFVRAVRTMTQILSERTAEGYVFRTDLRLRPDASVTPVAISMEAAERYYESFGRTWERAAYIKARPCAGDVAAGERFLDTLRPFVWRRHLDYAAIQDAQDMRLRIRDHKGLHAAPSHLGHDLKLGQGGIREIEFFTQTRQIIAGGRDPELRTRDTVSGLRVLAAKGWVSGDDAETLIADYRAHREAEHRVQMVADQQTHCLPETEEDFARLAALAGRGTDDYAREIVERLRRVAALTEGFFVPDTRPAPTAAVPDSLPPCEEMLERWKGFPALRSPRSRQIFRRVWPRMAERLDRAQKPDEALLNVEGFVGGLPAGVQLFSLFEANPSLLDLVVDIVDTAPGLGRYLSRNAGVFDAVIGGQFFADWPGRAALSGMLTRSLAAEADYEKRLDLARIWAREWHFRTGVHLLRGLIDAETSGQQYADLAGAVVGALWPVVTDEFARKYGPPPGRGAAILGMGSIGAERLNATSDLDLIVIYDGAGVEASDGRRPLPTRTYYARLTQSLVTALSAPTAEGRLYEVDMRLRPSGRQGPVATSLESFRTYQKSEAWTWEHLALTRARPMAGPPDLMDEIESIRREVLSQPREPEKVKADVADMRARLAEAKPARERLETRPGPGRLQDIELFVQTGALLSTSPQRRMQGQLDAAVTAFGLSKAERKRLEDAAALFWRVHAGRRLVIGDTEGEPGFGSSATAFLLRGTGADTLDALADRITACADEVRGIVETHLTVRERE